MKNGKASPSLIDEHGRDNLEGIRGIGPTFSEALKRIGICRFVDLARYTPEDLSKALREQAALRVPAERIESQKWIDQANAMARQLDVESASSQEESEAAHKPPDPDRPAWYQHAGFSVFFDYVTAEEGERAWQTRVYHEESGEEKLVRGTDTTSWANWILERAQLPLAVEPVSSETTTVIELPLPMEAALESAVMMPPGDTQIEILDTQVVEAGLLPGASHKKLVTTIRFRISGPKADALAADQIPFRVELHSVDLEGGDSTLVTSRQHRLRPQVFEYTIRQEFPLPDEGHYELHSIVFLLPPHEIMAHHCTPSFKVVT